jgi:hypothetical protein
MSENQVVNKRVDYNAVFDKMDKLKAQVLEICPMAQDKSGIYIIKREENGFRFAYVGQSLNVLTRLAQHLVGYTKPNAQHIDLSLKKRGLKNYKNPHGWEMGVLYCPHYELNAKEQYYIKLYANSGFQMYNKTSGSQDGDKFGISENKDNRGYREGVADGEKKVIKRVKELFDKYLDHAIKEPSNKVKERKLKEFEDLLKGDSKNDKGTTD